MEEKHARTQAGQPHGGRGGCGGAALEHTGHVAEISSIEMPEVGGGIRVSDSVWVVRWNLGSAHSPQPPCNPTVNTPLGVT